MNKKNGKKDIHIVGGDNIINFPKPPTSRNSRGKKDVEFRSRYTIHFEPDWDTNEDDPSDSKT